MEGENVNILPLELKSRCTKEDLTRVRKLALENTTKLHNYNKKIFDLHRKEYKFEVGDRVYVENGNRLNRNKLEELRIGPYAILKKSPIQSMKLIPGTGQRSQTSTTLQNCVQCLLVNEQLHILLIAFVLSKGEDVKKITHVCERFSLVYESGRLSECKINFRVVDLIKPELKALNAVSFVYRETQLSLDSLSQNTNLIIYICTARKM